MNQRRTLALGIVLVLAGAVLGAAAFGVLPGTGGPDDAQASDDPPTTDDPRNESAYPAQIDLYDGEDHHATIRAETATDRDERYTGLSEHEGLGDDEGMLFVYPFERDLTYVMRNMSFGIDIVYVDENACITSTHAAPEPGPDENGENQRYPGRGQYVLEVSMGVVTDSPVGAGDPVRIQYDGTTVDGRGNCSGTSEG